MIFGKSFTFFLHFFQKYFQILCLHQHDWSPYKFQNIYVLNELWSHLISYFEWTRSLNLIFSLFIRSNFLRVPPQSRNHFFHLWRSFVKLLYLVFDFVFEFTPIGFCVGADWNPVLTYNGKKNPFFIVTPTFFFLLALCLILKINLSLILLDFHNSIYQFFQSSSQVVCNWEILIRLSPIKFSKAIFLRISDGNIVGIAIFVDSKKKVDIIFFAPPNCRSLSEKQSKRDEVEQAIPINFSPVRSRHVFQRVFPVFMNKIFNSMK